MLTANLEMYKKTFHLDLSLQAEAGQTTVLLGESGAGKSTVLRLMAGLEQPVRGLIALDEEIYFDSERRISRPPQERPFGYVFQDYTLFPHLTVYENVAFGLKAQGLPGKQIRQRVGEVLELVHLPGYEQRRPGELSGGQQQRVAIARALVLRPALLLLDEPLSALDVQTRRAVRQELRQILLQTNLTTLLVTHQYLDALLLGQRIIVLEDGHIVQQGSQSDLVQRPRSAYVAELVGMNLLRGRVKSCEARTLCTLILDNGVPELMVQASLAEEAGISEPPTTGSRAYVVIDPRAITLAIEPPATSARNVLSGTIVHLLRADPAGGRVRVSIDLASVTTPLIAEITEASAQRLELVEGQVIYASFKATEALAYT